MSEDSAIEAAILAQVAERGAGKTICPTEVARALSTSTDDVEWRTRLSAVRRAAIRLAIAGRIDILRKGRRVEPIGVKGVIRLGLPTTEA